jgi:two-component system nitrogen regulation sensor histidine kinase GlnL
LKDARRVLDALDVAVIEVDPDFRIIDLNAAAEELVGRSAGRARGRLLRDLQLPAAAVRVCERALATGAAVREGAAAASPLVAEDSDATAGVALAVWPAGLDRDRAPDYQALAAGLAHEIKNPLAGLKGAADLLAPELNEKQRAYTSLIAREAERLDALVRQMLELARPLPLELRDEDLNEMCDRAIAVAPAGPRIERRYDPSLPPVRVDAARVVQVLLNLLRNAVDAGATSIVVETGIATDLGLRTPRGARRLARAAVIDDGPGLSSEALAALFTPFFTTRAHGTGMGLVIARQIAEAHGGLLEVSNRAGGGAQAQLYLPMGALP